MGLDIYTYKTSLSPESYAAAVRLVDTLDEQAESQIELLRKQRDEDKTLTYDEYKVKRDDVLRSLLKDYEGQGVRLGEHGLEVDEDEIELPSLKFPDHLWKIGYCRGSYNDSGFDRVAEQRGVPTLNEIFEYVNDDDYIFNPDWEKVKANAIEARKKMHDKSVAFPFHIVNVHLNPFRVPATVKEFLAELEKRYHSESTDCISAVNTLFDMTIKQSDENTGFGKLVGFGLCREAKIIGDGETIVGVLAFKKEETGNDDWYVMALDVLIEHCDWVLAEKAKDPSKFFIVHWSG